ncbi:MAG: hypothetical protein QXO40_03395 [Candidatus Aenigmatarchaeota archaeon]
MKNYEEILKQIDNYLEKNKRIIIKKENLVELIGKEISKFDYYKIAYYVLNKYSNKKEYNILFITKSIFMIEKIN